MAKYKPKTTENTNSVLAFINQLEGEQRKKDALAIVDLMQKQSGLPAKMWGSAIIGFGSCHYKYESGHEGDMPLIGFSPRKTALSLYLSTVFDNREELLKQFGKHKSSKACIYIKKLADIDVAVLKKMITASLKHTKLKYKKTEKTVV